MSCRIIAVCLVVASSASAKEPKKQYEYQGTVVSAASATEAKRDSVSVEKAVDYLEKGAMAWSQARKCVSCHTNGTYMLIRPELTGKLGAPSKAMRDFFVAEVGKLEKLDDKRLMSSTYPTRVAYVAAGLAQWDRHVANRLSAETERALRLLFRVQSDDGAWGNLDCWPPLESSRFHGATVAAMAVAIAPGWLEEKATPMQKEKVSLLKKYLRTAKVANDYQRLLLLWVTAYMPDLLPATQKADLIEMTFKHQRADGGWSIRTFSTPEKWGGGNRAKKLLAEPEYKDPPSDGHQTGLALIVLRQAGIPADDPRIRRGADWLLGNQRVSGRWWTRSLNTDSYHFITYSGTAYPLLALQMCGKLPK